MAAPLELYLLTFNCARALIDPSLLGSHLLNAWPKDQPSLPDVIAISLQEVAPIAYAFLGGSCLDAYYARVEEAVEYAARRHVSLKSKTGGLEGLEEYGEHGADAAFERVATHNIGMTAALVFARKPVLDRISSIETAGVGVGVWEMGNKGGVGVRLTLADGREVTFVAMHLAPMENKVVRRNKDWENIVRGLVFEDAELAETLDRLGVHGTEREPLLSRGAGGKRTSTGLYKPGSTIFLAGDLNYRTSHLPPTPNAHKTYPQPSECAADGDSTDRIPIPDLLARDQLTHEREAGRTLHGFDEETIEFPPTYKYSHSRSETPGPRVVSLHSSSDADADADAPTLQRPRLYTWAPHRWPSWCDRILYYPSPRLAPRSYTSLPLLPSSDHQAVALHVTLSPSDGASATSTSGIELDLREQPPFELDAHWRERRARARSYEVIVGAASWLALTREGNAFICGVVALIVAAFVLAGHVGV